MKPVLKAPGTKRLKLKYEKPVSRFAFSSSLCRYTAVINGATYYVTVVRRKRCMLDR